MRIVGYVRDSPDAAASEPAFAQAEQVRRWISHNGHQLVAVCQDVRVAGRVLGRAGFRAMIGVLNGGRAQAVLVPSLDALSPDKITQEIMLWDLRILGAAVLSATESDLEILQDPPKDSLRLLIRDVLAKVGDYVELLDEDGGHVTTPRRHAISELSVAAPPAPSTDQDDKTYVIVNLVPEVSTEPTADSPTNPVR